MSNYTASYNIQLTDNFSKILKGIEGNLKSFEGKLGNVQKKVNSNGGGMGFGTLASFATKAFAAIGLFEGVKGIVKLGSDMEVTRVKFSTFMGSLEMADKHIKDLQKLGAETPFEFTDLEKSSSLLQNFGVKADQLIPTIRTLGDLSAGSAEKLDSITLAYGKIKTKGKATMEELNMLIEGGQIPIMAELAKVTGKSGTALSKFISDGKVGVGDVQQAFKNLTGEGGMFNNMMAKQSQTLAGRWSTLIDTFKNVGVGIGTSLLEPLGKIVDAVSYTVDWISGHVSNLKLIFQPIVKAMQPLFDAFQRIAEKMGLTGDKGEILKNVFNAIGNAITFIAPIIEVIADTLGFVYEKIADVVLAIGGWIEKTEWVQKVLVGFYTAAVSVFKKIAEAAKSFLGGAADLIVGIFTADPKKIKEGIAGLAGALKANPINLAMEAGGGFIDGYKKGFDKKDFFSEDEKALAKKEGLTEDEFKIEKNNANGNGKADKDKKEKGIAGLSAQKPTTYNITIENVVKEFTLETTNLNGLTQNQMKEFVVKALMTGINDINIMQQG